MLNFLEKLPNIYIVFAAFILTLVLYLITREQGAFQLVTTIGGALTGLAMKTNDKKPPNQIVNAETLNTDSINSDTDKTDAR
jgi:predicted membrane channel-forming protein YqfA (hemolysin III family)